MLNYHALPARLQSALENRGYSQSEVEAMTAARAISEYAFWHLGDTAWGHDFYDLVRAADKAEGQSDA